GAAGGITNARGLANMYAPLAGSRRGALVGDDTLARMARTVSATGQDATGLVPSRFAARDIKSTDNRRRQTRDRDSGIASDQAFGHIGFGGCIGFADPRARMSFGYAMNKMGGGVALNPRGQSLIDATYRSLGYTSDASGSWVGGKRRGGGRGLSCSAPPAAPSSGSGQSPPT